MSKQSTDSNTAKDILKLISEYVGVLYDRGFDTKYFYYNRSRLFLSISSHSSTSSTRSKKTILLFILTSFLRLLNGLFSSKKIPSTLIVDTREYYGEIYKEDGYEYDNVILSYLYDALDWKKIGLLDRFNLPFDSHGFRTNWNSYFKNLFNRPRLFEELILFKYLLSHPFSWWGIKKDNNKYFHRLRQEHFEDESLNSIHKQFLSYQKSMRFFLWKEHAYVWYFKQAGIQKLLILDEYSPNQRCLVHAASILDIECIALQHGGMHDLHPGYIYGEEDSIHNIFPSQFLTWGASYSKFLKRNNWNSRIQEVGHPRTDIINRLKKNSKSDTVKIMFASQPHKDEAYTEHVAKLVFEAFAKIGKKIEPFLRPHPLEHNLDKYQKWASEAGLADLNMEAREDLYVALANTDMVITAFSTVGQEAIYFNIPLITVDYLERDIASFEKEKVAVNAQNSSELEALINQRMDNSEIDTDAYNTYINKYAHRIDGKVHDRILKILLSEQ